MRVRAASPGGDASIAVVEKEVDGERVSLTLQLSSGPATLRRRPRWMSASIPTSHLFCAPTMRGSVMGWGLPQNLARCTSGARRAKATSSCCSRGWQTQCAKRTRVRRRPRTAQAVCERGPRHVPMFKQALDNRWQVWRPRGARAAELCGVMGGDVTDGEAEVVRRVAGLLGTFGLGSGAVGGARSLDEVTRMALAELAATLGGRPAKGARVTAALLAGPGAARVGGDQPVGRRRRSWRCAWE